LAAFGMAGLAVMIEVEPVKDFSAILAKGN
jgi:hypothetical protein